MKTVKKPAAAQKKHHLYDRQETNARFYELGINLRIVNPRLVVYPEFIPGTTFCVYQH